MFVPNRPPIVKKGQGMGMTARPYHDSLQIEQIDCGLDMSTLSILDCLQQLCKAARDAGKDAVTGYAMDIYPITGMILATARAAFPDAVTVRDISPGTVEYTIKAAD